MGGSTGGAVERELIVTGIGGQGVQLATQVLALGEVHAFGELEAPA
jgi:hypothetical protein